MDYFTPESDITKTHPDGREELVAAAGVPIPMAEAKARGLVKDAPEPKPSETKPAAKRGETKTFIGDTKAD